MLSWVAGRAVGLQGAGSRGSFPHHPSGEEESLFFLGREQGLLNFFWQIQQPH